MAAGRICAHGRAGDRTARAQRTCHLTDESPSWLDGIRAFFTPKMTLAAAGFAALVICAALTLAVISSQKPGNENIVAKNTSPENNKQQVANSVRTAPRPVKKRQREAPRPKQERMTRRVDRP